MPMTVAMREAIELKKIDLWCEVYKIAEANRPRRGSPADYANVAVENFENKFNKDK